MIKLRKPTGRVQGLKILVFGEDGSGKTVYGLQFPKIAVIDAESKIGVYENNKDYNKNLVGIADTSNYYEALDLIEEIVSKKLCNTLMVDSETYVYEAMQVSAMEVEEERARKKGGDPTDQAVSQRGWGKIKLNTARLRGLKAQASAKGITLIVTAHKEDVMQKVGNDTVKVGEKPALRKNSGHEYDVIIRFYKDKDLATGKPKYMAEIIKDTTNTFSIGDKIQDLTYENSFKSYIENNSKLEEVDTNYDKTLKDTMETISKENEDFESLTSEFEALFKDLKEKDANNVSVVKDILSKHGVVSYKKPESYEGLKKALVEIRAL